MRFALAAVIVVAIASCGGGSSVLQRGIGPRLRAPTYDGQPMTRNRELDAYVDGGTTNRSSSSIARLQFGAAMRLRHGPSWDTTITIDAAPNLFMTTSGMSLKPPAALSLGVGGTIRKSAFDGPFRLGLLAGAQLWRVAITDEEGNSGGNVAPMAFGAVVPSLRFGAGAVFLALSFQAAVQVPGTHEPSEGLHAETKPAAAASLGARFDVATDLWFSLAAGIGVFEDQNAIGGSLAVGRGFD